MLNHKERNEIENILPDAAGLFYALRSMGYENTAAIADLIDNSIDANAQNIWISIDDNLEKIFIADDGVGMSAKTLKEAIRLGGKKAHDGGKDLGKYGLGLITASISMGRVVRIITKNDGEYNTASLDYDNIRETNLFVADFHKSTDIEKTSFDYRTKDSNSGTVLIIDKCDKLQYTKAKDLVGAVKDSVAQVFRIYLSEGKNIYINDVEINAYDPLLFNIRGTSRLVDKDITIRSKTGIKGTMHVLASKIPDQGVKINRQLHLNIHGQGFYILRNKREIASALEFADVFKKHNDFNLFRIELSFNSDLDDLMGINLKKHEVTPSKEIINALKALLEEPTKNVRALMKAKQKKKDKENPFINPTNGASVVDASGEKGGFSVPISPFTPTPSQTEVEYAFKFSNYAGSENDPLFKAAISNGEITIRYNICNNYYSTKILSGEDGSKTKEILDDFVKASIESYLATSGLSSAQLFAEILAKSLSS